MNTHITWHDPVVAEIHAVRDQLASQYHNDTLAYTKAAEAHCRELGLNIIQAERIKLTPLQLTASEKTRPMTHE